MGADEPTSQAVPEEAVALESPKCADWVHLTPEQARMHAQAIRDAIEEGKSGRDPWFEPTGFASWEKIRKALHVAVDAFVDELQ